MMKHQMVFIVALCMPMIVCFAENDQPLSSLTLDSILKFEGDQKQFEKRIRTFEKMQLFKFRHFQVREQFLSKAGKQEEANSVSNEMKACLDTVGNAYEAGLAKYPDSAFLNNFYGEYLHDFAGKGDEAEKHWLRAIELDADYGRALNNLGMYCCHVGNYKDGLQYIDKSIELEQDNPDYLYNAVQVYLIHYPQVMNIKRMDREEVFSKAMTMSARAVSLKPDDFELLRDYALNFFMAEDFGATPEWRKAAKAWQAARKRARTEEERFNTWLNEARVHKHAKNKRAAERCLQEAQAIWPESPIVRQLINDFKE